MKKKNQNHQTFVGVVVGLAIGTVMGASAIQISQQLAFIGINPNFAKSAAPINQVDSYEDYEPGDFVLSQPRIQNRISDQGSVEKWRDVTYTRKLPVQCRQYSGARLSKCIVEDRDNNVNYQPAQTINPYE
ncbi:hypothetical protein KJ652_07260 [Patescibacteria group bacterium]|nr:hypothetical protein [Patescibacteria group bacterium]MBU1124347.1 hypothetical protein [Patescibacteria group bacterium]MBU1911588.1 hypothetical protein [Patescibacteria group bacterium]